MSDCIISPIFYMGNKKKLINKGLIDLFPIRGGQKIDRFVDLFGGSGIVSMNTNANRIILNDSNNNIYNFYKMFCDKSSDEIIRTILHNIDVFDLPRVGVKQNSPEAEKYKPHYIALRDYANSTKNWMDIYTCMFYAFSQQMRFNNKGDFNMPFGNGAFTEKNEDYIQNGCDFFSQSKVSITNNDFRVLRVDKLNENDFVYLDPPYLNTTATYNEGNGWTSSDESDLYDLCCALDSKGIKFGMSNVFSSKGKTNTGLMSWCNEKQWSVFTFDKFTYMACGKGNAQAQEVYICNY